MRKRNCETLSLSIFLVRRQNFSPKNSPCVEAELQNFKWHNSLCGSGTTNHIIVCMWNLSGFLWKNPKCPRAQDRRPLCQSHLLLFSTVPSWRWPLLGFFSLLRSYQASSNQLTCDKDPDIRKASRPKTAGTKLPKEPIRRDEGNFLTLKEGPRKGFSPVLPRALAGACWPCHAHCESRVLATYGLHIVLQ